MLYILIKFIILNIVGERKIIFLLQSKKYYGKFNKNELNINKQYISQ